MTAILIIALIVVIVLWFLNRKKLEDNVKSLIGELSQLKTTTEQEKTTLRGQISTLEEQNKELSKYQGIIDADKKAKEILTDAETSASALLTNAQTEVEKANIAAKEIRSDASKEARTIRDNAEGLVKSATVEARKIVDNANKRAEEIAGDAYKAVQDVANLEKTAQAMKNIIEGYGDRYLVPTYSLLDDLAEEFGHVEAGDELKKARERTRLMIKNGTAAKCDYVEANRKETAINFVLDAFNGKVDTIFSTVKKDNYGTLEQKIKDAYQVVNNNGKAFRNAVITDAYLHARLAELKRAVTANEVKWQEREEQRRIKEQLREEEKARREYEKAIKEAEKEEDLLKKAIEKAQKEITQANEEQKAKYEEKLRELTEKLKAAMEKNQRAISMAQQTKSGNVYIISNIGSFGENVYKIGLTRRLEPLDRIRELGDSSVPFEFDVHALIFSKDAPELERELHKRFIRLQMNKVNPRKEFFRITLKDIREEIEKMGVNVKWSMAAGAREYRESLATEKAIAFNTAKQKEWLKYQLEIDPVAVEEDQEP